MKMISRFSFLALTSQFLIAFNSSASNPIKNAPSVHATELMYQSKALLFEENKGQLMDENRKVITDVKYYGHSNGAYLYCKPGMLSFVFTKIEKDPNEISEATNQPLGFPLEKGAGGFDPMKHGSFQPSKISTSRMDLVLINSNPSTTITATDQQEYYENFYTTGDADHGITNVHTFKTITYQNIYPKIDMILKTAGQGMEYSFLVHPGGKVSDIKLRWNGTDKAVALENGGIKFCNALGGMEESAPKSFVDGKEVKSWCVKEENNYGFKVENYNKSNDLLIDPSLVWGTYYGVLLEDLGFGVCTDDFGNAFITGYTNSDSGIATSGAYQTSFSGGSDVFLAKFSPEGNISWATYYGGSGNDVAYGLSTDGSNNAYITGTTTSIYGIATSGANQTSYGGGAFDSYLAKFNLAGVLVWGTYYGGTGDDDAYGIRADGSGNIYISGQSTSSNGIATSGAYQTSNGGGYDCFLAKFSSAGKISWATYYGGSENDFALAVTTYGSGMVYITGETGSINGIATLGSYQTTFGGGGSDVFLAKFNSAGAISWATYYGGSSNYIKQANGVSTDALGNIYIVGSTDDTSGIATYGSYQTSYGGGSDVFLAKFSSSGSLSWGTYYGGSSFDYGSGISADASDNIYITGSTQSLTGIATSGTYQTSYGGYGGYGDAFLAKFNSEGVISWATYYGGSGGDVSRGVITDAFGDIYITGWTNSSSNIATSGGYQTFFSGGADAFLAKFHDHTSSINSQLNNNLDQLSIYPNPFTDKTLINFTLSQTSHVKIIVMDIKGNVLFTQTDKTLNSGPNEIEINASEAGLSPGTYFVNIMINDQMISKKIIEVK